MRAPVSSLGLLLVLGLLAGCATGNPGACNNDYLFIVAPTSGTADHAAKSPGNQFQFQPGGKTAPDYNCKVLDNVVHATYAQWTSADPVDVTVSSASDETNGLATCVNATANPVTLTAVATPAQYTENGAPPANAKNQTVTVTLTCK